MISIKKWTWFQLLFLREKTSESNKKNTKPDLSYKIGMFILISDQVYYYLSVLTKAIHYYWHFIIYCVPCIKCDKNDDWKKKLKVEIWSFFKYST